MEATLFPNRRRQDNRVLDPPRLTRKELALDLVQLKHVLQPGSQVLSQPCGVLLVRHFPANKMT